MSTSNPMPTTDNLFKYMKLSKWHFITANFSGFVKKEFDSAMARLGDREIRYRNLQMLIQMTEMGNYAQAKDLLDKAEQEYGDIVKALDIAETFKSPWRPAEGRPPPHQHDGPRRQDYDPVKRDALTPQKSYTPDQHNRPSARDQYAPEMNERSPRSPVRENGPYQSRDPPETNRVQFEPHPEERSPRTPVKNNNPYQKNDPNRPPYESHRQEERSPRTSLMDKVRYQKEVPSSPLSRDSHRDDRSQPRTPMREEGEYEAQVSHRSQPDPHKANYDSLRLKSPDHSPGTNQGGQVPGRVPETRHAAINQANYDSLRLKSPDHSPGTNQGGQVPGRVPETRHAAINQASHMSSHAVLWGRDHGDKAVEKVGDSTYRQSFHAPSVVTYDRAEREDRDRYRENFGRIIESADERNRFINTPEHDENRPSEIARRFKELYMHEWTEAFDEVVRTFGADKTIRHLLWIITEAYTLVSNIAAAQLKDLERQAVVVMTAHVEEAWLICLDIADKQLKHLEKMAVGIMETPGPGHANQQRGERGYYVTRNVSDTLPTSKKLLLKYRRQTAALSIPYVREECRDKICRTLMESSGFPKHALNDASRLVAYLNKGAELVWLMTVQDPPIVLEYINKDTEGARFNQDHYKPYTRAGTIYDYGVWPMLRQDKRGPIISRGIAQGI